MIQIFLLIFTFSSWSSASTGLENFVKNSIFTHQRLYSSDGPKHGLSLQQVEDSLSNEFIGAVGEPMDSATLRHCFALKPTKKVAVIDSKIFGTSVLMVNSIRSEGTLTVADRNRMLSSLRQAGLFSGNAQLDEMDLEALNHFYCRKVLGLVAPVIEIKELEWLKRVHPESLITNHELLDGLQNFSKFPAELVISCTQRHYDWTLNQAAMNTFTVEGLAAFLRGKNYNLLPAQAARLSKAKMFSKLLACDLNAWQAFFLSPIYLAKFKSLRGLYEKLIKKDLSKAPLVAFYFHLQTSIGSALFTAAVVTRGMRPVDLPFSGEEHLTHLKDLLRLNVQVVEDLKSAKMANLVELFSTPLSWILRAALSSFDQSVAVPDFHFDYLAELIPKGPSNSVADQIADYRAIAECLGAAYWPAAVSEGYGCPSNILQLVSTGLDFDPFTLAIKALVMIQISEAQMFFTEAESVATMEAALPLFKALSANVFTDAELELLKSVVGNPESLDEREVECRVSAQVRSFEGDIEALIDHAFKDPVFFMGLSRAGHVLNHSAIEKILASEKGIRLLSENAPLLHGLRTYEHFTPSHLKRLHSSFDVERVGTGLNTFPLSLLIGSLYRRRFELNDPTAFLSRFDYSWWMVPEFQSVLAHTLNINSISQWLAHFREDARNIHRSVGLVIGPTFSHEVRLIEMLWWNVRQQVKILDFLVFFELHFDRFKAVQGFMAAKMEAFHFFTKGLEHLTDQILYKMLLKECLALAKEPERQKLVKSVLALIKTPLCEVIAGALMIANGKTGTNPAAAETAFPCFKQLYSGWLTRSSISGDKDTMALAVHEDMKVQRQCLLDLLKNLNCSSPMLASFEARLRMLGMVAAHFDRLNAPMRVKEVVQLMRDELPLWEAKIVARLVRVCNFPVAELEMIKEEGAFLVDEVGIVLEEEK